MERVGVSRAERDATFDTNNYFVLPPSRGTSRNHPMKQRIKMINDMVYSVLDVTK